MENVRDDSRQKMSYRLSRDRVDTVCYAVWRYLL